MNQIDELLALRDKQGHLLRELQRALVRGTARDRLWARGWRLEILTGGQRVPSWDQRAMEMDWLKSQIAKAAREVAREDLHDQVV